MLKLNKLRPPFLPVAIIDRPHLLRQLNESIERDCLLTLLSTPLGYGKTTLLAQYAIGLTTPWAWLRCENSDNTPYNLLLHLRQAIGVQQQPPPPTAAAETQMWAEIIECLERKNERFTLFFDDLQHIRSRSACRYLNELLRHPPIGLHILAASEGVPNLALSHLHRDRRLNVLGIRHFTLDSGEVHALATAHGHSLNSDANYLLRATCEGWISGVLLSFPKDAEQPLDPTNQMQVQRFNALVTQFFEEEVLRSLSIPMRLFLKSLAVVNAYDAELAVHLSGRNDARALIHQLQRQDLFIQQHGNERLKYRLHPLLRQTLYRRFRQDDPDNLNQLHQRAAHWLLQHECYAEAIYQLGRGRDFNSLLTAIERHSFDLLREGKIDALVDFFADIPGQGADDHFTLAITEASTVIVTNDIPRATASLRRLQRLLRHQMLPERRSERAHQTLAFLRSRLAFLGGNFAHGIALVTQALERYTQINAATAVLLFNRASCFFALGQLQQARRDTERALNVLETLGFSGYINLLHLQLGLIELAQGQTARADERFANLVRQLATAAPHGFYNLFQHLGQSVVLLLQNQLPQACKQLAQAEAIALEAPHSAALPWVLHHQAMCLSAQGQTHQARLHWDEARRLAGQFKLFAVYRLSGAWRVRLAVLERDHDFIHHWFEEWHRCRGRCPDQSMPEEWLAYAWVQRHLGQRTVANKVSSDLHALATAEDNQQLHIELYLLDTYLRLDEADRSAALLTLESAVQLASRNGFGQLLTLEGRHLGDLLRQLASPSFRRQNSLEQPLPAREKLAELLHLLVAHGSTNQPLFDPLTRREQDVLRRMAEGQGNQLIADALYISLSTVKTHINNLFRKLDAVDREGALQTARELKLLS
ncbi:LuxR C-terminal-related transcriptional regulator [Pseudomonas sp. AOB-7]|uniref:LuxR C-terminal-related transcriptional regulator n=1 Tax=Pseudomonas sp. AOB-7 TaxID=2482750 RepID=UPI0011C381AF|nr:LuxR C-terminal-related transcriptional regulator [Pseudomonas sp. AOB-7]